MIELDHLVLAARSLEEGARWVEERAGVAPEPGGQHLGFGTHNALLRLGPEVYLEVLAPDPAQPAPEHRRLFGLDEAPTRAALAERPRLLHWVVRARGVAPAVEALAARAGVPVEAVGVPTPMRRGGLRWTLALPPDGSRPAGGLPSVIDWGDAPHPCTRLPDRGVRLERLELTGAPAVIAALVALRGDPRVALLAGLPPRCTALLASPRGAVVIA